MTGRTHRADAVAWLTGLVPFAVIHVAYVLSASTGLVEWCVPYVDGCTSISRAARQGNVVHVYRATMLPYTAVLMAYWWLAAEWLRHVAPARTRTRAAMLVLGQVGALFLALYSTFLGVDGEIYQWMRRYGVTVHFSFTTLAQILLAGAVAREARFDRALRGGMLAVCAAMLALGLLSIPLQHLAADRDAALNALEWCYALLMSSFFPLSGLAWRRSGFRARLSLD